MLKSSLLLILVISSSFALIDPPIEDVTLHNFNIAPSEKVGNVFSEPEKNPSLDDPTFFFYVKILTLNPAVNKTIDSGHHPSIIWLVAEEHVGSITSVNGRTDYDTDSRLIQYTQNEFTWDNANGPGNIIFVSTPSGNGVDLDYYFTGPQPNITFLDPDPILLDEEENSYEPEGCSRTTVTRTYYDLEIENVSANYRLTGIINEVGGNLTMKAAERQQTLATGFPVSPVEIPFKDRLTLCDIIHSISDFIFAGYLTYECYEESLSHASPYATGTYNLTVRNLSVVDPNLTVILDARFYIPYDEEREVCHETEDGCECNTYHSSGEIDLRASDQDSYQVTNNYLSIIPYSPAFMDLNVNTSEDVIYYFSLLSTVPVYKYYSWMDGNLSSAYYIHNFTVSEDPFGTQFINANILNHSGILDYDPLLSDKYLGPHRLVVTDQSYNLRNPTEITNRTYNYSLIYTLEEIFFNLSSGSHHADLDFYTWWGHFPKTSDIYARQTTFLRLSSYNNGSNITIGCNLVMRNETPISNAPVIIDFLGVKRTVLTDQNGSCSSVFMTNVSFGVVRGEYEGNNLYLPSTALTHISKSFFDLGQSLVFNNFFLLLLLSLVALFSFLRIESNAVLGAGMFGSAFNKFSFLGKGGTIKLFRVKKGKELALSVAGAVAGGAAGSAAAGKAVSKTASQVAKTTAKKGAAGSAKPGKGPKKDKTETEKKKRRDEKKKKAMMEDKSKKGFFLTPPDDGKPPIKSVTDYEKVVDRWGEINGRKYKRPGTPDRLLETKERFRKEFVQPAHERIQKIVPGCRTFHCEFDIVPDRDFNFLWTQGKMTENTNKVLGFYDSNTDIIYLRESYFKYYDMRSEYRATVQNVMVHEMSHSVAFFYEDHLAEGVAERIRHEFMQKYPDFMEGLPLSGRYVEYVAQTEIIAQLIGPELLQAIQVDENYGAKSIQVMKEVNQKLGDIKYDTIFTPYHSEKHQTDLLLHQYEQITEDKSLRDKIELLRNKQVLTQDMIELLDLGAD